MNNLEQAYENLVADYPGYGALIEVFMIAIERAARGKGKDRHATDDDFDRQPIMERIGRYGVGFPLGQADKKIEEAMRLGPSRGIEELLDAMVYEAAAVIYWRRHLGERVNKFSPSVTFPLEGVARE